MDLTVEKFKIGGVPIDVADKQSRENIVAILQAISSLESSITGLQGSITNIQNDIAGLNNITDTIQDDISSTQRNVSSLQTSVNNLNSTVSSLQSSVSSLQDSVSSLQISVSSLQNSVSSLQHSIYPEDIIANALQVDTNSMYGSSNYPKRVVNGTTAHMPTDVGLGIRYTHYYNSVSIIIEIVGVTLKGIPIHYMNYFNGDWVGWYKM